MKELSLNILDIAQNSIVAKAKSVEIRILEENGVRTLVIKDDGMGMDPAFVKRVVDPFTTTRTTRKVGLGLPFLKLAAEQAGGRMTVESSQGEHHGTCVTATFRMDHIDCQPVGDIAGTMVTLIQGNPDIDFIFVYCREDGYQRLSTIEMKQVLDGAPINAPEVLSWVRELLTGPFEPYEKESIE